MRIPRIYSSVTINPDAPSLTLGSESSHYLGKVLRLQPGHTVHLFDGELHPEQQQPGFYRAEILALEKKSVTLNLTDFTPTNTESQLAIHLGIGVSKGEKLDWVIQKATELGVTSITPLSCQRSDVRIPAERLEKRLLHWRQVAISACEQCQRNQLPQINTLNSSLEWAKEIEADYKLVLHHRAQKNIITSTPQSVAIIIGPEGGLSAEEITSCEAYGFQALKLGPRVMRTETAPIAALSILQARYGDMGFE